MNEVAVVHIAGPEGEQCCIVCGHLLVEGGSSHYEVGAPVAVSERCVYRVGAVQNDPETVEVWCVGLTTLTSP